MSGAMDLGIADHGERTGREQTAQIAIASFADTAKPVLGDTSALALNSDIRPSKAIAEAETQRS